MVCLQPVKFSCTTFGAAAAGVHGLFRSQYDAVRPCSCRAECVLPSVHVAEGAATFPSTFIGAASQLPLTLVNTTPVPATLLCDLTQQPEFELTISREDWAGAGYSACPVQRIGANGEMSTVGSMLASRRCASM
jgi:hypothetical protein